MVSPPPPPHHPTLGLANGVQYQTPCCCSQTKKGKEKKAKFQLAVADSKLGSVIQESCGIPCVCNELVGELMRGVRAHTATFIKGLSDLDMRRAQLGLAHSYSRAKVRTYAAQPRSVLLLEKHLTPSMMHLFASKGCQLETSLDATTKSAAAATLIYEF